MALMVLNIILFFMVSASGGGVTMTSQVTPYQVTFGADGRLRMEEFNKKTACRYDKEITTEELQHNTEAGYKDGTVTEGEQYGPDSTQEFLQSPCATYQTKDDDNVRIPTVNSIISFPVRLDFTLKIPENMDIEVRFMGAEGDKIYAVEFKRGDGIEIEHVSAPLDLEFDESHRFWVTYENGEVKVGLHGTDSLLVQYTDPDSTTNQVEYIELYSETKKTTEWKFYEPCTSQA